MSSHRRARDTGGATTTDTPSRSYYGADGRLRAVQRFSYLSGGGQAGVFEEYRYDALARRVMVMARGVGRPPACDSLGLAICSSLCSIGCDGQPRVTWATWDGDRIVSEERQAYPERCASATSIIRKKGKSEVRLHTQLHRSECSRDEPLPFI